MKQIKEKGYAKKYEGSGKETYLAAFAFLGRDDIEMKVELLFAVPNDIKSTQKG
ncbi:MAG: PD-(D/E)XK nuclease domain-containing protein [Clostridiales bacterium]|nr:PD-(D/E)XK nuclease domain-containing protein [Clostridiales bacterium]